jgi:hypothetical protein
MIYEEYIEVTLRSNHERRRLWTRRHKETTYATVLDPRAHLVKSEIGDVRRFGSSDHLTSYAGLVPSTRSSESLCMNVG